jgi:DNA-binding transcriptional ArsR family regulator
MPQKKRRLATAEERKALAHPIRLRILRLCLDESLTNKEIADALGQDPGSTLFHVRKLMKHGFLELEDVRAGKGGALEKPYRATGKSWELDMGIGEASDALFAVDAFRAELLEAGHTELLIYIRAALQLNEEHLNELGNSLQETIDEFAELRDADGRRISLFVAMHERPKLKRARKSPPPKTRR